MTDTPETPKPPKVVRLDRKPFEPAPAEAEDTGEPRPDEASKALLKVLGEMVETGIVRGLVVCAWNAAEDRFERMIALPEDEDESNAALRFSGGLQLLSEAVLDVAAMTGGYLSDMEGIE